MYLKIETDNKQKVISTIEEVIEKTKGHRIYTQMLENGCYLLEVIEQEKEPFTSL